jgi:hypothetical protein
MRTKRAGDIPQVVEGSIPSTTKRKSAQSCMCRKNFLTLILSEKIKVNGTFTTWPPQNIIMRENTPKC